MIERKNKAGVRSRALSPTFQGFLLASVFNIAVILFVTSVNKPSGNASAGSGGKLLLPRKLATETILAAALPTPSSDASLSWQNSQPRDETYGHILGSMTSDVWARGAASADMALADGVKANLSDQEFANLRQICGRCLYHSLLNYVQVININGPVFVATGDIPDMWTRDSSVQMGIYLPRISKHPILRHLIEGTLRTQAYFTLLDPWANAFSRKWKHPKDLTRFSRQIGRGGFVATRNFELDSGAYFMNFLWNYFNSGVFRPDAFLSEPIIYDAVSRMVDVWIIETRHEEQSPYRYSELPRDGLGGAVAITGMIWSGFRASDDPQTYGYNIAANMYAAGALQRMLLINKAVWGSESLTKRVTVLLDGIEQGLEEHGTIDVPDVGLIYAYEVDGLGGVLHSTDDPNLPSLMSMPLLGYQYNRAVWERTKDLLYSSKNPYFYKGKEIEGLGSTHTPYNYVWSLAHMVLGLMTNDSGARAHIFRDLLKMQGSNGLMHESLSVDNPQQLTRPEFEWANAMFVTYFENTFGEDCDGVAMELRDAEILQRESAGGRLQLQNGGNDIPQYFDLLEMGIKHADN